MNAVRLVLMRNMQNTCISPKYWLLSWRRNMRTNRDKLSNQLRQAIIASGLSRYRICKILGIAESTLSRFMSGQGGLSMELMDRVGELLNLRIVAGKPPKIDAPGRGRPRKER